MTVASTTPPRDAPSARPGRRVSWAWLGVMPFVLFAFAFLVAPTLYLASGSFQNLAVGPNDPALGVHLNIYSKTALELAYLYFQFPLMVLIIAPAIDGLRKDWREASENMGASAFQYWRYVALPILLPSLLGTVILLFGNAFGAQATAFQLSGGA